MAMPMAAFPGAAAPRVAGFSPAAIPPSQLAPGHVNWSPGVRQPAGGAMPTAAFGAMPMMVSPGQPFVQQAAPGQAGLPPPPDLRFQFQQQAQQQALLRQQQEVHWAPTFPRALSSTSTVPPAHYAPHSAAQAIPSPSSSPVAGYRQVAQAPVAAAVVGDGEGASVFAEAVCICGATFNTEARFCQACGRQRPRKPEAGATFRPSPRVVTRVRRPQAMGPPKSFRDPFTGHEFVDMRDPLRQERILSAQERTPNWRGFKAAAERRRQFEGLPEFAVVDGRENYADRRRYLEQADTQVRSPVGQGGRLQVRIVSAHDLKNMDTGLMGDVSDPFVVARVGMEEHKTPTINNSLNPLWTDGNLFTFTVRDVDATLQLEVMNSNNVFKNDCIGRLSVPLRHVAQGSWQKFRERLRDGNPNSEIEFELCLETYSAVESGTQLSLHGSQIGRARQDDMSQVGHSQVGHAGLFDTGMHLGDAPTVSSGSRKAKKDKQPERTPTSLPSRSSEPGTSQARAVTPTSGGPWSCSACYMSNAPEAARCEDCGETKPPVPTPWICKKCEASNEAAATKCANCKKLRPHLTCADCDHQYHVAFPPLERLGRKTIRAKCPACGRLNEANKAGRATSKEPEPKKKDSKKKTAKKTFGCC
eukprot:TRINITY_DN5300_c1_g5_i1.p1 TRINITY_DN5300_c1_g5~~TRINITY_DN5300_c1_g5_i1.p1  ORF type:complete len:665 (-),score=107.37 TRINITY_DN5300_c1_g5_i1:92-2023(-)